MAKLWRCEICGDPYVGDSAPDNCPFCGAKRKYIKEARQANVIAKAFYIYVMQSDGLS